jgi:hypothetical protein
MFYWRTRAGIAQDADKKKVRFKNKPGGVDWP